MRHIDVLRERAADDRGIDFGCEGQDLEGEGVGGVSAEADLLWYVRRMAAVRDLSCMY